MNYLRSRHMGRLNQGNDPLPRDGETISRSIPDTNKGILFQIGRMVEYVRQFKADPLVVQTARRVVELCNAKDKLCEVTALFHWTKDHYRYVNDPVGGEVIATPRNQINQMLMPPEVLRAILGDDLIQRMIGDFGVGHALLDAPNRMIAASPFERIVKGGAIHPKSSGDCDEGVTLLGALIAATGMTPRFRVGGSADNSVENNCNYHHIWIQAQVDGRWVDLDVTEKDSTIGWYYKGFDCYGHIEIF